MDLRQTVHTTLTLVLVCTFGLSACDSQSGGEKSDKSAGDQEKQESELEAGTGVDLENKTIHVGALNDESGAADAIGTPFAVGKRILVERVNEGDGKLLPDGWSIELHEKDHGYNPSKAVQSYKQLRSDVLFFATSFGTPNTLPLRKFLEKDNAVAFPASLSSKMAEHEHTPPLAPSYKLEAMRAMDYAVQDAGSPDDVKAGIVYQKDDYGKDGLLGWKKAADKHGVDIVAEETISPGQEDVTAVVKSLKDAGANYVMLTTLPSTTGPILGTAGQLKYAPTWLGNTPAWIDKFFAEDGPLPAKTLKNFMWVTGFPYWGEDVPGMETFMETYKSYGKDKYDRDFYILTSYIQGLVQLEILRRCIDSGALTRKNFIKQMHTIEGWNADGMVQELSLSEVPYVTGTEARVLKPVVEEKTWEVAGDYATPKAFEGREAARKAIEKKAGSATEEAKEKTDDAQKKAGDKAAE